MRIIIIGPAYPYRGGIADTDEALCRALQQSGHDARLVTFTAQYPKFLFPGKTQYSTAFAPKDLSIDRLIHSYKPLSWGPSAKQITQLDPELVIFRFWTPMIALAYKAIAHRLPSKTKVIAMIDNASPHESGLADRWLTRSFLQQMQGAICLSDYVAKQVRDMHKLPVTSYPHPINTGLPEAISREEACQRLDLDPKERYLLFFGLVRAYKGLDLLLKSLAKLPAGSPKLIVAGEWYDKSGPYLEMIQSMGIADRVIIHDRFIAEEELASYFCAADLLTLTYHTASQSGVTQMGMHYDVPMLVTDVGALSEYVDHERTGYVLAKDPADIAQAIESFYDKDRSRDMRQTIKADKSRYDWGHFSDELLRFVGEEL